MNEPRYISEHVLRKNKPGGQSRREFLKLAATAGVAAAVPGLSACGDDAPDGRPPNVIVIFADDLGYGDLACYGSETIRTPNLDGLADAGMRFTDFHVTCSVCSPSRASLLTGRYTSRCGMPYAVGGVYSDLGLQASETTVARLLKDEGYATACIGKWHLGVPQGFNYQTHEGFTSSSEFHPNRHGFDLFYGMVGNTNPDGSTPLLENDGIVDPDAHVTTITEHFTRRAIDFIRAHRDRPFFIYLPHTRSHAPWMANPRLAGQSRGGVYGDMVEEIDWSTGEVLKTLDELGLTENTLVIFASDNGASPSPTHGSNAPLRGGKGSTFEGGMRVPCIMRWPGGVLAGQTNDATINVMDLLPTIAGLAGAPLPEDRVIDGMDLRPVLSGAEETIAPDRMFYYYNGLNLQAVREGPWKLHLPRRSEMLVWWDSGLRELEAPMLFDLETDPGETNDLAAQHPEVVEQLLAKAEQIRAELGSWEQGGRDQKPIEHLMDDRRRLRHLRTQQGHRDLGRDISST